MSVKFQILIEKFLNDAGENLPTVDKIVDIACGK